MDTAHQRNCRIFHGRQGTASKTAQQDHIQNCKNTYGKPHCRMHGMHQLPPFCFLHIGGKKCKQKQWHQTKKDCQTSFHHRPGICLKKAIQIFHLQIPRRNQKHYCKKYKQNDKQNLIHPCTAFNPATHSIPCRQQYQNQNQWKRLPCNQPLLYHVRKDICPVSCHPGKIDQQ